jgi:glycerol kinase
VTGVLFDADLRPIARSTREFQQRFPRPGWVEHEAADILAAVDHVVGEIVVHPRAGDCAGIGITNQRETVFALERGTNEALRPGIVWQDRRTAERCAELAATGWAATIRARTGLLLDPYFSATKIEWMLRNDAELRRRAERGEVVFATVDALVVGHLTGAAAPATDPTNASRTMLFDIGTRAWDPELCRLFGLEPTWLPEVRSPAGSFGSTVPGRTAGRALPILGVAGDQQAALFGQGGCESGAFKATYGTGSFLMLHTGAERRDSTAGWLTTLAVGPTGAPAFALEGSVFVCGALVQWLRDQMGFFEHASDVEALARSVPDNGGVTLVPAFAGLGAPYWDPDARGAILGLTRGSSRAHIARAALEAIALQNAELVELLRGETGLAISELVADGGAAANDFLMQLQADLAGLEVRRATNLEATARGAAGLAGLAAGLFGDVRRTAALQEGWQTFPPQLELGERERRLADWRSSVGRVRTR